MVPYGGTATVTDTAGAIATTDAQSNNATWINLTNRAGSSQSFDVSWNAGTTYITRLAPGESFAIGGRSGPAISVSSVTLRATAAGGTTTVEYTCVAGP